MKIPQQADSVTIARCPCGCGFVHVQLLNAAGEIFAIAPFAPCDGRKLAKGLASADHGPDFPGAKHPVGQA